MKGLWDEVVCRLGDEAEIINCELFTSRAREAANEDIRDDDIIGVVIDCDEVSMAGEGSGTILESSARELFTSRAREAANEDIREDDIIGVVIDCEEVSIAGDEVSIAGEGSGTILESSAREEPPPLRLDMLPQLKLVISIENICSIVIYKNVNIANIL